MENDFIMIDGKRFISRTTRQRHVVFTPTTIKLHIIKPNGAIDLTICQLGSDRVVRSKDYVIARCATD